jgi:hypothetical protein
MNYQRMAGMLFCSALVIFLASCGGGGSENKNSTDTTANTSQSTAPTTPATPANTIVTTPQDFMVATHKVKDFAKWMTSYEGHDSIRLASGIHSYIIARGLTDTSIVLVAVKVDDIKKAEAFSKSPDLKKAMQKSGVVGAPTIKFTTMVYQDMADIGTTLRSRTTFSVKDWNAWKNNFDSSRQQRADNGIVDRAYGHDANDDHKITVVVALTDTAKAFAYWKSPELKKRMAESGMIGQPQRFLYNIVKKY